MSTYATRPALAGMTLACLLVSGCAGQMPQSSTTTNSTAAGAALGALAGGLAGGWQGAAIGLLSGAAVGWATGQVLESQQVAVRNRTQDQQLYGYATPTDSVFVNINSATSSPQAVTPNSTVEVTTDYSLALPKNTPQTQVLVSSVLLKDGAQLMEFKDQPVVKSAGGYTVKLPVKIPAEAAAGTYVIKHTVKAGTTYDTAESTFVVKKA